MRFFSRALMALALMVGVTAAHADGPSPGTGVTSLAGLHGNITAPQARNAIGAAYCGSSCVATTDWLNALEAIVPGASIDVRTNVADGPTGPIYRALVSPFVQPGNSLVTFVQARYSLTAAQVSGIFTSAGATVSAGSAIINWPGLAAVGAAAAGSNGDITSLNALTKPITVAQGGTGATTGAGALTALGLNIVTGDTTRTICASGCDFTSLPGAKIWVDSLIFLGDYTVILSMPAQTYTLTTTLLVDKPQWNHVHLIGAGTAATVINATTACCNSAHAIDVESGGGLGLIDNLTIHGVGAYVSQYTWNNRSFGAAIYAKGSGVTVHVGGGFKSEYYYYGLQADHGSDIECDTTAGVTVNYAGDVAFHARYGGSNICPNSFSNYAGATTIVGGSPSSINLGFNYLAEDGTGVWDGSKGNTSANAGVMASAGGRFSCLNCELQNSVGRAASAILGGTGFVNGALLHASAIGAGVDTGGKLFGDSAQIYGNSNVGIYVDNGLFQGFTDIVWGNTNYNYYVTDAGTLRSLGSIAATQNAGHGSAPFGAGAMSFLSIGSTGCTSTSTDCQPPSMITVN